MTTETILIKRRALYPGEIGLFPSNPMASEDLATAKMNEEVVCKWYSPQTLKALKFLWALVHKVQENTDLWSDKDKAMEDLKKRAGFTKTIYDNSTKKLEEVPKSISTRHASEQKIRSLTNQIIDVICRDIWPGMKPGTLRKEIEEMIDAKPR